MKVLCVYFFLSMCVLSVQTVFKFVKMYLARHSGKAICNVNQGLLVREHTSPVFCTIFKLVGLAGIPYDLSC